MQVQRRSVQPTSMSGDIPALALRDDDVTKMLSAAAHIGSTQCSAKMVPYVWKCRADGVHILRIDRMWEKLLLAARAVAAVENPKDVSADHHLCPPKQRIGIPTTATIFCSHSQIIAVSTRPLAQRAVLKFAHFTGATAVAGRFTPGTFTNHAQRGFREPRLLICSDPLADHQAIFESAYANVPVVAFCQTDARLKHVDVAVPCNTKSVYASGLMWWMLTREVLRLRGQLSRSEPSWSVVPDLFFYRDAEEVAKDREAEQAAAVERVAAEMKAVSLNATEVPVLDAAVVDDASVQQQQQWPDTFSVADWNEDGEGGVSGAKADEALRVLNSVSATTWGAADAMQRF